VEAKGGSEAPDDRTRIFALPDEALIPGNDRLGARALDGSPAAGRRKDGIPERSMRRAKRGPRLRIATGCIRWATPAGSASGGAQVKEPPLLEFKELLSVLPLGFSDCRFALAGLSADIARPACNKLSIFNHHRSTE